MLSDSNVKRLGKEAQNVLEKEFKKTESSHAALNINLD